MDASHSAMQGGFERNDANLTSVRQAMGSLESALADQAARQAASLKEISLYLNRFNAHMTHQQRVSIAHRQETGVMRQHLSTFFDQLATASTGSAEGLRMCGPQLAPSDIEPDTEVDAAPQSVPPLELLAAPAPALTDSVGQPLVPICDRHTMSPHVKTVSDLWEEYDIGWDGQLPLRKVEADYGAAWCGGGKSAKRKQFVRRMVIIKRIEAADPERRAEVLAELTRAAGNHSLDWLRKQMEAGNI
ncbi:unnamed protein product [Parajaminaea phylloscopi]